MIKPETQWHNMQANIRFGIQALFFQNWVWSCLSSLDPNQYSWGENYAGSSGLMSVSPDMNPMQRARSGTVSYIAFWTWCCSMYRTKASIFLLWKVHYYYFFAIFFLIFKNSFFKIVNIVTVQGHISNLTIIHFLSTHSSVHLTLSFSFL